MTPAPPGLDTPRVRPRRRAAAGGAPRKAPETPGLDTPRGRLALYATLAALVAALGLLRLHTGPWYFTYSPWIVRLLEGFPVEWEADYYLAHFPTFLGDARPSVAMSLVHRRVLLELWLATALAAWTGSAFWGMALVDLGAWGLAGVATFHLGRRLDIGAWPAALAAFLVVGSPLLVSNMWAHVFHVAEFATLPIGLWAGLALLPPVVPAPRRHPVLSAGLGLGLLLLVLSLSYQYQWIVAPLLAVAAVTKRGARWRERRLALGALAVGLAVYLCASGAVEALVGLAVPGSSADVYRQAVSQPGALLLGRLGATASPAEAFAALRLGEALAETVLTYHPLVFAAGIAGLLAVPAQVRWLTGAALLLTLGATTLYGAPWTAMSAYPLVYLGAGAACAGAGRHLGDAALRVLRAKGAGGRRAYAGVALAAALAALLFALTNADLAGDARFLQRWWGFYSGPNPF